MASPQVKRKLRTAQHSNLLRRSIEWRSAELGIADLWLLGDRQMLARALSPEDGDETADVFGVSRLDCDEEVFNEKLPLGVTAADGGAVDAA